MTTVLADCPTDLVSLIVWLATRLRTVIAHLLEVMTNKRSVALTVDRRVRSLCRKPVHPVGLHEEAGAIELGGINTTVRLFNPRTRRNTTLRSSPQRSRSQHFQGNEKIVLSLIWRYIVKYDLDDPDGEETTTLGIGAMMSHQMSTCCRKAPKPPDRARNRTWHLSRAGAGRPPGLGPAH